MAKLSPEEKAERRFQKALETSRQYSLNTVKNQAASKLQECIRAEYGAKREPVTFYNIMRFASRRVGVIAAASQLGHCWCVTCGRTYPWKGSNKLDTGHFLASRRNSILFDERGLFPQCSFCNRSGGMPEQFRLVMLEVHGQEVIDDLERLKHQESRTFTREGLVRMRLSYMDRTKAAVLKMGGE